MLAIKVQWLVSLKKSLYKVMNYLQKRTGECIILRMVEVLGIAVNLNLFPSLFVSGE